MLKLENAKCKKSFAGFKGLFAFGVILFQLLATYLPKGSLHKLENDTKFATFLGYYVDEPAKNFIMPALQFIIAALEMIVYDSHMQKRTYDELNNKLPHLLACKAWGNKFWFNFFLVIFTILTDASLVQSFISLTTVGIALFIAVERTMNRDLKDRKRLTRDLVLMRSTQILLTL